MIKISEVQRQLEDFFKDSGFKYKKLKNKKVDVPIYLLKLNIISEETNEVEQEINIMITTLSSGNMIIFETLGVYETSDKNFNLEIINDLNSYLLPGKFVIYDNNSISYRCLLDYEYLDKLYDGILISIIDSIPPAYFLLLGKMEKTRK